MKRQNIVTINSNTKPLQTICGNDFEIGYKVGKLLKKETKKLTNYHAQIIGKNPKVIAYLKKVEKTIKTDVLQIYNHILGRAKGAEVDFYNMMFGFCGELRDVKCEHCTSIMVHTKNNIILAHNEDGNYNQNSIVPAKFVFDNGDEFLDLANTTSIFGWTVLERKDFVYTVNYIHFDKPNFEFLPVHIFFSKTCTLQNTGRIF